MKLHLRTSLMFLLLAFSVAPVWADEYTDTIKTFRDSGESSKFFGKSYGYAVFPTIGKGGMVVGGGYGKGRVYEEGKYVGDTSVTQISVGLQLGGEAYSQIVFFENKHAFDEFTSGSFEFTAEASAVAITAAASAETSTDGTSVDASGTEHHATTAGEYTNGMAVFIVVKGGLMSDASIGGQKFSYTPR